MVAESWFRLRSVLLFLFVNVVSLICQGWCKDADVANFIGQGWRKIDPIGFVRHSITRGCNCLYLVEFGELLSMV